MEFQLQVAKKTFKEFVNNRYFLIFVAFSFLAILHIQYVWKISEKVPALLDLLGWISIGFLLWKKQDKLKFRGNLISSLMGIALIFWMILRHSLTQSNQSLDVLAYFFPVIVVTGLLMIVKGFAKLLDFNSEIMIASLISLPFASIYAFLKPIVNIDAQLLSFMLHYIGFKVVRQGAIVNLPNGSVEVMASCSSVSPILTMLPFIVVLLAIYPVSKIKQLVVYISAIASIIFVNNIRLCLLAILINKQDIPNFDYWHTGGGAGIFSNLIVFVIGGISYKLLNNESTESAVN
jgi:cyanoexosortase A